MSEWTVQTLKEYVEKLREADSKAVAAALASAERAVEKAEINAERWRSQANEWRGAMNDRERVLMPRSEAEVRLAILEKAINNQTGRASGANALWIIIAGAIGVAGVVVALLRH